jgi:5-hydroxyisourate hydrolase-like protein (transthyretin family)
LITFKNIFLLSFCLFLFSCAQISAPTGGEKDTTPPTIIEEKTIPTNFSTNFNSNVIEITFDEYFTITNPNQNVLITPILDNDPKFITKGKKLIIELNDTLKENTTYTINFGETIKDYNAGNVLTNFSYVFSTGSFIDSMETSGIVYDAKTGKPAQDIKVMLYNTFDDSVVTNKKPNYLAVTNKQGKYNIKYIKEDVYKVFALKDENRNYKFDLPNEQIAFLDSTISMDTSTKNSTFELFLFEEDYRKQQITAKKYEYPGKLSFAFNRPVQNLLVKDSNRNVLSFYQKETSTNKDSIVYWNIQNELNNNQLIIEADTLVDTIKIYPFKKPKVDTLVKLLSVSQTIDKNQPVELVFDRPIESIDTSKINITKDSGSIKITSFNIDSIDGKKVYLNFIKKEKEAFTITISPDFITDIYSAHLKDSLSKNILVRENDYYGILNFNLLNTNESIQYIVQLFKGDKLIQKDIFKGNKINYKKLTPGKYNIYVVIDENKNNKWDTGNYYKKLQPETIIKFSKPLEIRSNWELEESLVLSK